MRDLHVVSFSGGKDSTAMLLGMIERNMPIDIILYCDTSVEFPAITEHVNKVEHFIKRRITRLENDKSFEYLLLHHPVKQPEPLPPKSGYSFPSPHCRWCTSKLKTQLINSYLSNLPKSYNIIQYIGIAYDEQKRIKQHCYPLVDWHMTEKDCLNYCYASGFDFGGIYEIFDRVSCWCCPLQSLNNLRALRKHFPELWAKILDWQTQTYRNFKLNWSAQQLEQRFQLEDARQKLGLTINPHNPDFIAALKQILNP